MSMSQQVSSEVQAVVSLTDSQTEHSPSHIAADAAATSLPAMQDSVVNESFDDYAGNTTLPHDTSFQQLLDHGSTQESSAQTDPVTIIIGDASFLVKKVFNFCFKWAVHAYNVDLPLCIIMSRVNYKVITRTISFL